MYGYRILEQILHTDLKVYTVPGQLACVTPGQGRRIRNLMLKYFKGLQFHIMMQKSLTDVRCLL